MNDYLKYFLFISLILFSSCKQNQKNSSLEENANSSEELIIEYTIPIILS